MNTDRALPQWASFIALAVLLCLFLAVVNSLRCLGRSNAEALRAAARPIDDEFAPFNGPSLEETLRGFPQEPSEAAELEPEFGP